MNTYRIYEELRSSLGEDVAKSLAHTLGPMFEELGDAVTKTEFRELNATVGRLAAAQERTEEKMAQLAGEQASLAAAQGRTEVQLAELTKAQVRTDSHVAEVTKVQIRMEGQLVALTDAQTRMQGQLVELAQAQTRTEGQVAELTQVLQSLATTTERQGVRLDGVIGRTFETQFRDRLTSYLGRLVDRLRLLHAEHPAARRSDGPAEQITILERRAGILRKAGLVAVPLVACEFISPESLAYARSRQVRVWCNGTILDAAA